MLIRHKSPNHSLYVIVYILKLSFDNKLIELIKIKEYTDGGCAGYPTLSAKYWSISQHRNRLMTTFWRIKFAEVSLKLAVCPPPCEEEWVNCCGGSVGAPQAGQTLPGCQSAVSSLTILFRTATQWLRPQCQAPASVVVPSHQQSVSARPTAHTPATRTTQPSRHGSMDWSSTGGV